MLRLAVLSFWHVHAKDYLKEALNHADVEVVAVWDEDVQRGQVEAERYGIPFDHDLDGLLRREDIDGVVVTTPTNAHLDIVTRAAQAGKHVFTEKVIAPTLTEAEEIVRTVEQAGVAFHVSLPRLYAGYARTIRNVLDDGRLGRVTYLRVRVSHDGALRTEANPDGWLPDRFYDPVAAGGGVTIDFGAHPLYLTALFLGMPEQLVASYGDVSGRGVEDHSVVTMRYPGGAIAVAESSFLGTEWPFGIEAHGTEGSLFFDLESGLRWRKDGESTWVSEPLLPDDGTPFQHWVELAKTGARDSENIRLALALTVLAEAANQSAATGKAVRLGLIT